MGSSLYCQPVSASLGEVARIQLSFVVVWINWNCSSKDHKQLGRTRIVPTMHNSKLRGPGEANWASASRQPRRTPQGCTLYQTAPNSLIALYPWQLQRGQRIRGWASADFHDSCTEGNADPWVDLLDDLWDPADFLDGPRWRWLRKSSGILLRRNGQFCGMESDCLQRGGWGGRVRG